MLEHKIGYLYLRTKFWFVVAFSMGFLLHVLITSLSPGEKVILVPPMTKEAKITGKKVNNEYLEEMALFFVPYIANIHPKTVDETVDFFLRYVGQEHYGELKSTFKAEAQRIKQQEISQVFYPKKTSVSGNTVVIDGQLRRYIGEIKTSEVPYRYEITFEKNTINNLRLINNITHSTISGIQ